MKKNFMYFFFSSQYVERDDLNLHSSKNATFKSLDNLYSYFLKRFMLEKTRNLEHNTFAEVLIVLSTIKIKTSKTYKQI